ncbi:hypothetical protein DPMN_023686 [Dreissena polymorpha]|uniref:Uncharacterized protein n=1 Tax=Dreissena polymorpha TaxID=45954 RepID=A0A9D4LMQ5_DREPO|nr:hypothetical protein DPMN_023686 [Dreissena polymorpha]
MRIEDYIFKLYSIFNPLQIDTEKNYKQFMIVKPSLTEDQCHPEEGVYLTVTEDIWRTHMMDDGVIEDDYQIRKARVPTQRHNDNGYMQPE